MFTHDEIWRAIDRIADAKGFSASGLARHAGLDPTAFNRSKRISPNGKPRWPSTESLAKILQVTGSSMEDLLQALGHDTALPARAIPMLSYNAVRSGKLKTDKAGSFTVSLETGSTAFALNIDDDRLRPLYRPGCVLVADPGAKPGEDDRILFFSKKEGLKGGIVQTAQKKSLTILLPEHDFSAVIFADSDIAWTARILWASQ